MNSPLNVKYTWIKCKLRYISAPQPKKANSFKFIPHTHDWRALERRQFWTGPSHLPQHPYPDPSPIPQSAAGSELVHFILICKFFPKRQIHSNLATIRTGGEPWKDSFGQGHPMSPHLCPDPPQQSPIPQSAAGCDLDHFILISEQKSIHHQLLEGI